MNSKWSLFSFSALTGLCTICDMGIVDWPIFVDYLFLTNLDDVFTLNSTLANSFGCLSMKIFEKENSVVSSRVALCLEIGGYNLE